MLPSPEGDISKTLQKETPSPFPANPLVDFYYPSSNRHTSFSIRHGFDGGLHQSQKVRPSLWFFRLSSIMRENSIFCLKTLIDTGLKGVIQLQIHGFFGTLSLSIFLRAVSNCSR